MAAQSRSLMDEFFRRVYIAIGVLFALLVFYRVFSILLARRLATHGTTPGSPPPGRAVGRAEG